MGRKFIVTFDWNYSKISIEDAKKRYMASVEAFVELKKVESLVLQLQNPIRTDERMVSTILVNPRTFGHSLDELLRLSPENDLEVTVVMLKHEGEERSWDRLRSRDIEYLGVGFLRVEGPPSPPAKSVEEMT